MTNASKPGNFGNDTSSGLPTGNRKDENGSDVAGTGNTRQAWLQLQVELIKARREIALLKETNAALRHKLDEKIRQEADARVYAYRDELTGLPNRRLLNDRLQQAIAGALRYKRTVALLLIDMDGYRQVNETYGAAAGNRLLRLAAGRLKSCTRAADTASLSGPGEFVILLPDLEGTDTLEIIIHRLKASLDAPYVIAGEDMPVAASIACAVYPDDGESCQALLERN
ncbi:MAG TPA: GGDEF domain-containing protein [Noviherbaspirillum sp.]|nr:GGDEF domain-containing protein [Noviherbaspirillum sp.]